MGVGVGVGVLVGVGVGVSVGVGVGVSVGVPVPAGIRLLYFAIWRASAAWVLILTMANEMSMRKRQNAAAMSLVIGRALLLPTSFVLVSICYKLPRQGFA